MEKLPSLFCYKFFFYSKFWATDAVLGIKTLHFNSPHHSPSQKFKDRVSSFASHFAEPPVQSSASLQVKLVFWLNLIHIQQVALTIFYLPSSWMMFYCCLIVVVSMVWDLASLMFFSYSSRSLKWLSTGASFVVATSCFKYMGYNTCFHFMIAVLNLKLCFATDVLTERSGSLSEPGSIFSILI